MNNVKTQFDIVAAFDHGAVPKVRPVTLRVYPCIMYPPTMRHTREDTRQEHSKLIGLCPLLSRIGKEMVPCALCTEPAPLTVGKRSFCVLHYNDENFPKSTEAVVLDQMVLNEQTDDFKSLCKTALADLAMEMFDIQRKEENDNRLQKAKIDVRKTQVATSNNISTATDSSIPHKTSLWRTDLSTIDKEKVLAEIERKDAELDIGATESKLSGIACISCGSTRTLSRSRQAVESGKSDIWGNKDSDGGAQSIECTDCGFIGNV